MAAGRIPVERLVDVLSTTPARLFGLTAKGAIEVGRDADLVLFDPGARRTIRAADLHHTSDYTPYEGREVSGAVRSTHRARLVRRPRRRVRRQPRLRPVRRAVAGHDALELSDAGRGQRDPAVVRRRGAEARPRRCRHARASDRRARPRRVRLGRPLVLPAARGGARARSPRSCTWTCASTAGRRARIRRRGRTRQRPTTSRRSATRWGSCGPSCSAIHGAGSSSPLYGARHPGHAGGLILAGTMARFDLETPHRGHPPQRGRRGGRAGAPGRTRATASPRRSGLASTRRSAPTFPTPTRSRGGSATRRSIRGAWP